MLSQFSLSQLLATLTSLAVLMGLLGQFGIVLIGPIILFVAALLWARVYHIAPQATWTFTVLGILGAGVITLICHGIFAARLQARREQCLENLRHLPCIGSDKHSTFAAQLNRMEEFQAEEQLTAAMTEIDGSRINCDDEAAVYLHILRE